MSCQEAVPSAKDLRECANCHEPLAVVGGRLAHVSKEHAARDREAAKRFFVKSTERDGLRVTVAGAGAAEGPEPSLTGPGDGQNGRPSEAGGGDGSQDGDDSVRGGT
jgi:hypothetical protein